MFKKTSCLIHTVAFFCLMGCQTVSEKDCAAINWRSEGETLALNGEPKEKSFKTLSVRCKKFVTDSEASNFREGYQRGLAKLCTVQNGYDFAAKGEEYQSTCPDFRESNFRKGYYKGRLEYLHKRLETVEALYNSSEERVWRKEREYTIIQSQDPERAKLEADVLEAYREEARSLAQRSLTLKRKILKTKKLSAESFF